MSTLLTFQDLISGRAFDRFHDGLETRLEANRIRCTLTYGAATPKPAMWLDFETESAIGRVTLWETGECDMEILDVESGDEILCESHTFTNADAFFDTYIKVPSLVCEHSFGTTI